MSLRHGLLAAIHQYYILTLLGRGRDANNIERRKRATFDPSQIC
jgi:hypothetical protein